MIHFYDSIIQRTQEVLGTAGNVFPAASGQEWPAVSIQPLILEREKQIELGREPNTGLEYTLITEADSEQEDSVRLIGPDLYQMGCTEGCFGKIVFLKTTGINETDPFRQIKQLENMKYKMAFDGYMTRMSAEGHRENIRISKTAANHGISLERIGYSIIKEYKKNPLVKGVQIVFITADKGYFPQLLSLAKEADAVTNAMNKLKDYFSMDCQHCGLKPVCDTVEGMRELHQKQLSNS